MATFAECQRHRDLSEEPDSLDDSERGYSYLTPEQERQIDRSDDMRDRHRDDRMTGDLE
jgi:hypothetical protein